MYYVYPALFKPKPSGGYIVTVPSVPGCVTDGATLEEAMRMINDALCGCLCVLEDEKEVPIPSPPLDTIKAGEGEYMALIEADTLKYRSVHDKKSIRKNVSLPAWLNSMAEQRRINCSQVLQEALRERLGV